MKHLATIGTPNLRAAYDRGQFVFSEPVEAGAKTVVLIGSCRIVPFLNYLRLHNAMAAPGDAMRLICLNPVEMWRGVGCEVADGANEKLVGFKFGNVDFLICEHVQYCGVLNTVRSSPQNIYDNLGCSPVVEMRLPNWNDMHIFDAETAMHDKVTYANLGRAERVDFIRAQTAIHKARFLSHCRGSTFPQLEAWTEEHWKTVRLGWTSSHPSHSLIWRMFERVAEKMGLNLPLDFVNHPICKSDLYALTGIALTDIDREANDWKY